MYRSSVVSNLLCLINNSELETSTTYTKHSLALEPSQFIFLGLQELTEDEQKFMFDNSVEYYELSKINLKESSLNIFNDYSKFLIYKPIYNSTDNSINLEDNSTDNSINLEDNSVNTDIDDIEEDHGWFILRGMDLKTRNEILEIIGDNIILMTIPDIDDNKDMDVMVTATTIAEQNEISFYATSDPNDCALFPEEKASMMFELLNNN